MSEEYQKKNLLSQIFSGFEKQNFKPSGFKKIAHPLLTGFIVAGLFSFALYVFAIPGVDEPYLPGATLNPSCAPGAPFCTVYAPVTYSGANSDVNLNGHSFTNVGTGSFGTLRVAGYFFPTSIGLAGQFLATDASGALSWSTPAATGLFSGRTIAVATGGMTFGGHTGYKAGDDYCNAEFPGSHMCSISEILHTIATNLSLLATSGLAWTNAGAQGVADDCKGHSPSALDTDSGIIWSFTNDGTGGTAAVTSCSPGATSIACCQ